MEKEIKSQKRETHRQYNRRAERGTDKERYKEPMYQRKGEAQTHRDEETQKWRNIETRDNKTKGGR